MSDTERKLKVAEKVIQKLRDKEGDLRRLVAGAVPYIQTHDGENATTWMQQARAALGMPEVQEWNSEWPSVCGDCGDEHTLGDIEVPWYQAKDLANRLNIGHPLPAGECPKCRAWSYAKEVTP